MTPKTAIRPVLGAAAIAAIAALATLLAALVLAATPPAPAGAAADGATAKRAKSCGSFKSSSYYPKAKVVRVKGISCDKAERTARRYDHSGRQTPPLDCRLAHGGGRRLFSCENRGRGSGSLVAVGKGKRQG